MPALPLHTGAFPERQHKLRLLFEQLFSGRSHGGDGACIKLGYIPTLPISKRLTQTTSSKFKEPKNPGRELLQPHVTISPTSMLVNHLSHPSSSLASDHTESFGGSEHKSHFDLH